MSVQEAYQALYSGALLMIAVFLCVMVARSIRGPGVTDRLLSINMIGTLVIAGIVILAKLLGEAWLLDVALIYTMISFVSVLILARVFIPEHPDRTRFRYEEKKKRREEQNAGKSRENNAAAQSAVSRRERRGKHA